MNALLSRRKFIGCSLILLAEVSAKGCGSYNIDFSDLVNELITLIEINPETEKLLQEYCPATALGCKATASPIRKAVRVSLATGVLLGRSCYPHLHRACHTIPWAECPYS